MTKTTVDFHGQESLVDSILAANARIKEATAVRDELRAVLDEKVKAYREASRQAGVCLSSIQVKGTNRSLTYVFANKFNALAVNRALALKSLLGDTYDRLFRRQKTVKLKEGAIDALKAKLGDEFDLYFVTEDAYKPAKDYYEASTAMFPALSPEQKSALLQVEAEVAHRPALKE